MVLPGDSLREANTEAGRDHTVPLVIVTKVCGVVGRWGRYCSFGGDIKFQLICLPKQIKPKNVALYKPHLKNKKKRKLFRGHVTWDDLRIRMLQGPLCYMRMCI